MECFEDRKKDVKAYIDFLQTIGQIVAKRYYIIDDKSTTLSISGDQYKILIANAYLLLYNLIESTILQCFRKIEYSIQNITKEEVERLLPALKEEFLLNFVSRTENKEAFDFILKVTRDLFKDGCIPEFKFNHIHKNWDDVELEKKGKKYSINFDLPKELRKTIKKPYRNNFGIIQFIKDRRNKLAHGEIAFTEITNEETSNEVCIIAKDVFEYLDNIVGAFERYVDNKEYLQSTDNS